MSCCKEKIIKVETEQNMIMAMLGIHRIIRWYQCPKCGTYRIQRTLIFGSGAEKEE